MLVRTLPVIDNGFMDYQRLMDHQAFMDNQEYMSHKRNLIIWIIKVSIIPSLYPPPMTVSPPPSLQIFPSISMSIVIQESR